MWAAGVFALVWMVYSPPQGLEGGRFLTHSGHSGFSKAGASILLMDSWDSSTIDPTGLCLNLSAH
jgi:hypothetical protein